MKNAFLTAFRVAILPAAILGATVIMAGKNI